MAKKKTETEVLPTRIPVNEIEVGGVYKTAVKELVRVEQINGETEKIKLTNITGGHKQWVDFKHIYLVEKLRQSR